MSQQHNHTDAECRALLAQISDYVDGELEAALCAELEQHLNGCKDCRVLVDTTKKTVLLYRQNYQVSLPPGALDRLWQRLEDEGCK